MDIGTVELQSRAAVVHAEEGNQHNPYNLHHGFLVSRGVIPSDWVAKEAEIGSVAARIVYENGTTLYMDANTFQVHQEEDIEWDMKGEASGIAIRFLSSVSQDVFDRSSMHWVAHIPLESSHRWIIDHFVNSEGIPNGWTIPFPSIAFQFEADEMEVFLAITPNRTVDNGEDWEDYIAIGCGINSRKFEDCNSLIVWLSEWREHERLSLQWFFSLMEGKSENEL